MIQIPEVGDVVKLKEFAFTNPLGGTGLSNWNHDEKFSGDATVTVTKAWHDYETGWRYHGVPHSRDLVEYLKRNARRGTKVVYFGQFDLKKETA